MLVDAKPRPVAGKLVILYLGDALLDEAARSLGRNERVELAERVWDVDDPFLTLAAERLVEASATSRPGHTLFAEQLALSLAFHVSHRYAGAGRPRAPREPGLSSRALEHVVELVRADPGAPLTIQDLARAADLSPSHLIRAFGRATGMTPHRFVVRERVLMAQDILANSAMPVAELAIHCGFSSQSHLGSAFRAVTGLSPAHYRRLRRRPGR